MKHPKFTLKALLILSILVSPQNRIRACSDTNHLEEIHDQEVNYRPSSVQDSILLDSALNYSWDKLGNDWVYRGGIGYARIVYNYDKEGYLILKVPYHWNSETEWKECGVEGYSYDSNGFRILKMDYNRDEITQERIATGKTDYTYDESGNLTSYSVYYGSLSDWAGFEKREYGYDERGNRISDIHFEGMINDSIWIKFRKDEYAYDSNNNRILETHFNWEEMVNDWEEYGKEKYEYTYDENENMLTMDMFYWGPSTGKWYVGERRSDYSYDENGNKVLELAISWNHSSNEWEVDTKYEYAYNERGVKIRQFAFQENWDTKSEYFYDAYDNLVREISYQKVNSTETWTLDGKSEWYYTNNKIVQIPDTAFLHVLIDGEVDTNGDSLISYGEAEVTTYLDISFDYHCMEHCSSGEIKSLKGIGAFINLDTLICSGNDINSLDLSKNTALRYLDCHLNFGGFGGYLQGLHNIGRMESLNVLECNELMFLNCSKNNLHTLDLSNCSQLHMMNISGNTSLTEICVWDGFHIDGITIDTSNCPNIYFQLDCGGVCSTVGVDGIIESGFSIYPNPINTGITVESQTLEPYNFKLISLNGQALLSKILEGNIQQIDLSSFPGGVYFITIRSKDIVTTKKIIKL